MKFRIFALAFGFGFLVFFSAAAFFVFTFSAKKAEEVPESEITEAVFLEQDRAVFLLAFSDGGQTGPFTLVNFDAKEGRIPVFSFSEKAALDYGGVYVSAGALFSSVSPELFAGTVETNFGIELSGYFIWNRESAEQVISKAGAFDYVLPKDIKYSAGTSYVNLASGVQSMTGKKICDIATNPNFSEDERCETFSRITAAFLNRRLKRFLPQSKVYSAIFNYTETDVSAYDKERYAKLIEVLCGSGESLSGQISAETAEDPQTGFLYYSKESKEKIKRYFGG